MTASNLQITDGQRDLPERTCGAAGRSRKQRTA
jgi:hypothetical protein